MVYNVYRTDGNLLTTVNDGTVNTTTSLQLVGIGYAGYSKVIAENLVHLMENFSSQTAPLYPVVGQLWWDKNNKNINVYDGDTFRLVNNVKFSALSPNLPQNGDFWYDTTNEQLKIFNDSWTAISPDYTASQGISGQVIKTITDDNETEHVVTVEYNNNEIVAVYSSDSTFITGELPGISTISPGVNLAYGYEFNGTARHSRISEGLMPNAHSKYMHANTNTFTEGNISVNGGKITFGNSSINPNISYVQNINDTQFSIYTDFNNLSLQNTIFVTEQDGNKLVGIGNQSPQYNLDIIGEVSITENLYITSVNNNNGIYWDTNVQTGVIHNDDKLFVIHGSSQVQLSDTGSVTISSLNVANTTNTNGITNVGQITNPQLPTQPYHLANKEYVDQADTINRLPFRSVILWYGAAIDVPSGWQICDGTNGTPDLRNAFVFGAGGTASVGDTGGNNSLTVTSSSAGAHNHPGSTTDTAGGHDHTGTTGVHTLTIDQIPSHAHSLPHVVAIAGGGFGEEWDGSGGYKATVTGNVGGGSGHAHTISSDGSHMHNVFTSTTGAHTHTLTFDNRPSYVALYYIMRIS